MRENNVFFMWNCKEAGNQWLIVDLVRLLSCVTEHLAAKIVQLTVSNFTRAIEWMKCTYLYVKMKKRILKII
jgi:hypothetical protein